MSLAGVIRPCRRLWIRLAYQYYAWRGTGWPRWALEGIPWKEVAVRAYLPPETPCWHDRPTRTLPARVNLTTDFVPFWSTNLTAGPDPVYVDSPATKRRLMKQAGLREAGDRQGGSRQVNTTAMGWRKPITSTTGAARWVERT